MAPDKPGMAVGARRYTVRYVCLGDSTVTQTVVDAPDEAALRQQLAQAGKTVLSVRALSAWTRPALSGGLGDAQSAYPLFCRELKTLLSAGMTVVEATGTLCARERLEGRHDTLAAQLLRRLEAGQSLSAALGELPQTPAVLLAAVRAGERTSNLQEAVDDYLRFDQLVSQLRKRVVSAAIYPALVSAVGVGIAVFLLVVVMPNFASMYESLRGSAAGDTTVAIYITRLVGGHRWAVVSGLAAVALLLVVWVRTGKARQHLGAAAQRVPYVRQHVLDFQLAMVYQTLSLLVKGGYTLVEALQVAQRSALSVPVRDGLAQVVQQVSRGGVVSQALFVQGLCDEVDRRLMAAAERNGNFHIVTAVVSQMHAERFELFVERLTRIAEPVLLLLVALLVGGIVLLMYMPVFDMATQLL